MRLAQSWIAVALVLLCSGARMLAAAQDATATLKVEEEKMRFHLLPQSGLELAIVNSSGRPVSGRFTLELLNVDNDTVSGALSGTFTEQPGETIEKVAWPVDQLPSDAPSELGWYRLRYTFTPDASATMAPVTGIVQLGRIITDGFAISMAAARSVAPGTKYPVRVHVENPTTRQAYANIPVELSIVIGNDDDTAIKRKAQTDSAGNATVLFQLPEHPTDQEGTIRAHVARGAFSEEETLEFQFPDEPAPAVTITTDKPLYQPGQKVHIRLLAKGSDKRAMAGEKMDVAIEDENGTEQFHEKVITSRFGVASADWDIPGKMRLGNCTITVRFASEPDTYWTNRRSEIRISRYELPTFTVSVDPDKAYYLPNQNAVIDVHADYLFGKPVQRGKVKIVRQDNRKWNYEKQKWEADESQPVEGELGSDGHFKGTINLAEDFKSFQKDDGERFEDTTLSAYLTDSSTGRTEQRRFKIRLTAQPIHLYMSTAASTSSAEPILIYVMSSYADGVPASVDGKIFAARPSHDEKSEDGFDLSQRSPIGAFHTNRYGLGRVEIAPLPESDLRVPRWYQGRGYFYSDYFDDSDESEGAPADRTALLQLEAADRKGLAGTTHEEVSIVASLDYLRVKTDHTLYHPGDAIQVSVVSSGKPQDLVLNVWNEAGLLTSQVMRLSDGKASATVPFDPRFRGDIYVTASSLSAAGGEENSLSGWTQVLYPAKEELDVKLKMAQTVFRPGEEVAADLHVLTPTGEPTESALGVLVFDRAVAERVRTDEDFGREYGYSIFDYFGPSYQESIGGVSYRDLRDLDANKPFPEGLDLVAEGMIHGGYAPWMTNEVFAGGGWDAAGAAGTFAKWLEQELKPAHKALDEWNAEHGEYPNSEAEVRAALQAEKLDFDALRDPWGERFRVTFSYRRADRVMRLVSSGVDKQAGTADDFTSATFHWRYFTKTGMRIDRACNEYLARTGKYIRDYPTLRDEMKLQGVDLDALRDPWNRAYSFAFDIVGAYYRIQVASAGKDGVFDSKAHPVQEWTSNMHYFAQENNALGAAIADQFAATGSFPQNEEQLKSVLATAKLGPERLIDPWGHAYRFTFSTQSRYADSVTVHDVRTYSDAGTQTRKATEVTPVTQQVAFLYVVSNGPGNDAAHAFPVAEYSRVIAEQTSKQKEPIANKTQNPVQGGFGGLHGVVTDPTGAEVANATVAATSVDTFQVYKALADYSGTYLFASLPAGFYQVECTSLGFVRSLVQRVPVQAGISTQVDFRLNVGGTTETVEVTASADTVQTQTASVGVAMAGAGTKAAEKPLFTPRLRKYFPETLLWRPEVVTDKHGRAYITFPMADNITAWKMSVLASNEAGEVGIAEKELRSFQPFFLELDPPKILTEGDQISPPVVLRNYTEQPQTVTAEMQPEPWMSILSATQQSVTIAASGDASAVFAFRADKSMKVAKQRVTARNAAAGDAVERELLVHPNGQEISFATSRVLAAGQDSVELQIPQTAIRGSVDAELRIYPNLTAHVLDAMRGIGATPAGCGEQITSTAYVSLMALELLKKAAQDKPGAPNPRATIVAQARQTLQEAYDQLVDLQNPDGGFRYWNKMPSNVALTAYVLRFLNAAQGFIEVDASVASRARDYLVAQQTKTGAWTTLRWDFRNGAEVEVEAEDANLTAYIARTLAGAKPDVVAKDAETQKKAKTALKLALDFLEERIDAWSDAYLAGNYAIAAMESGRGEHIENARALLTALAHREGDTTYWNLEANTTPFYGWGEPGHIETTALAVEALAKLQAQHPDAETADSMSRGLQYLLTHKDRYATWYSTQATQNVLEALIAAIPMASEGTSASEATVLVNGRAARTLHLPSPQDALGPINVELAVELTKGANKIEIVRSGSAAAMNASVIASYYLPWAESEATAQEHFKAGEKRALRLIVGYDHTDAHVGERVHCSVHAERVGFRGYGMMLAEVGLPPGAEVDRASLEEAEMSPGVSGYEIQPERVVFYLWPVAGGTSFGFDFQMRYRIEAMSAPSLVYDYYNPEANATVAPVLFSVR
jgi:hypothetical protein